MVLGQPDFTNGGFDYYALSSTNLYDPQGLAFDHSGDLWVADQGNARVLEFLPSNLTTGGSAAIVLGQPDFYSRSYGTSQTSLWSPIGITFDSHGNLWVADTGYNRILEFLPSNLTTGGAAAIVLGQPDFTSRICGVSSTNLCDPIGVAFDSSNELWVADQGNARVLEFLPSNLTTGGSASIVLGQPDLSVGGQNQEGVINSNDLAYPSSTAFDPHGNLWVADTNNNRILEFTPPFYTDEPASIALGQPNMHDNGFGSTTPTSLSSPTDIAFDPHGNLWVADNGNNRILEFTPPFYTDEPASMAIGQLDLYSHNYGPSSTSLQGPIGITFDPHGNLWVADTAYSRILEFPVTNLTTGGAAAIVIGQQDLNSYGSGNTSTSLSYPRAITFDPQGDLWVADTANLRVLEFPVANLITGGAAAIALGQQGINSTAYYNTSSTSLDWPVGLTFDSSGSLWITDANRVLEFLPSNLTTGGSASLVLGQPDFTSDGCGTSPTTLCFGDPTLAFDTAGNLWVADQGNSRVLEYANTNATPINSTTTTSTSTTTQSTTTISGGGAFTGGLPGTVSSVTSTGATTIPASPTTTIMPTAHVVLNASYNITGNVPIVINITSAGMIITLTSSQRTIANLIVVNVTGSAPLLQSYKLLIALNVSTISSGNVSTAITLSYPCADSSHTAYPFPYKLKGATWVPINPFAVNITTCTATFSVPKDPVVGLFEYQPASGSTITTITASTIPTTTIPATQQPLQGGPTDAARSQQTAIAPSSSTNPAALSNTRPRFSPLPPRTVFDRRHDKARPLRDGPLPGSPIKLAALPPDASL